MIRSRLIFLIPLVLFLVLAGYFAVQLLSGEDPRAVPSALIDKPAPDFDLPGLYAGEPGFATADLKRGGPVLVNVFASWCVPCRAEHPLLMRLAEEEGATIFGLNYKDKRADAKGFIEELGNPYARIGFDGEGRVAIDWGVYGVPETYVIDGSGRIRYKRVGPLQPRHLEEDILPLLEDLRS
ncbi:DsbE family thiol:disulfide interchange protein [Marivibrio halodurans]|uniref:DsbE family thiol:disulfide interchange protein n=1 Tax=Marivibrio halodurans TaxID=2039722 RepID=A0A8J7SNK4_9PROT|nr:DsbE family thiol:disulfide interchange protein [Marivibrio halodurans]MBP5858063.1 DsbE family thiol:disulfide interchange protein [Marivibrio halodurans]